MMSTQTISEAQMEIFRSMTDSDGVTLNDNYRPPQPLNARTIYTTGVSRLVDLKRFTFFDDEQGCRIVVGVWQQKICVWQKIA